MLKHILADPTTVCTTLKNAIEKMEPGQEIKVSIKRLKERNEWFVELSYPTENAKKK